MFRPNYTGIAFAHITPVNCIFIRTELDCKACAVYAQKVHIPVSRP